MTNFRSLGGCLHLARTADQVNLSHDPRGLARNRINSINPAGSTIISGRYMINRRMIAEGQVGTDLDLSGDRFSV